MLDTFHTVLRQPSIELEKKVEEGLSTLMEDWVRDSTDFEGAILAALWLLQRRAASIGSHLLKGSAIRSIGSMIGGLLMRDGHLESEDPH